MNKPQLSETDWEIIKAYAECDTCVLKTKQKIYLAQQTINYHLSKIHRVTGLNPRKFYDLIDLLIMERGRSEADHMTALDYMERQLAKHKLNYKREYDRGVPK